MDQSRFPGSFFGPPTLVELARHRACHQGNQNGYLFLADGETEEVPLTYGELDRQARAIAAWLQSQGLAGERALLLYPAGTEFIASFFGCLYAGVVAVPAYPPRMNRSLERIQAIAHDSQAKVALTTSSVLERVRPLLTDMPDLERLTWLATDEVPAGIESQWRASKANPEALAFLQYTSGSTGAPKGVMLSHANLLHNCALIGYAFELTHSDKGVFWLPSYHDMGLVGGILAPLYQGTLNVLMSPMSFLQRPFRWLQAISRYRAATSGGPNFAYDLCIRKITPEQRAQLDLSSWSVAFNGAEPVRGETLDRFAEMFEPCGFRREAFYPCYGLAEATLIVSGGFKAETPVVRSFDAKALENRKVVDVPAMDEGARRLVGSGHNLPDEQIVIAHPETMTRCAPGEVGEIWVSNPGVAQGYWQRPVETAELFHAKLRDTNEGPFLRTGDLGFFQDGELYVAGRLKDLIIIRGLNHYPNDIELTVEKSHEAIRPGCGAAFTVESSEHAKLVIVYEIDRRQKGELAAIFDAIRRDVSREHELIVDSIVLVKAGSIPKTSSGKIQRHACRNAFLAGSLEIVERSDATTSSEASCTPAMAADRPAADKWCDESAESEFAGTEMAEGDSRTKPASPKPLGGQSANGRRQDRGQAAGAARSPRIHETGLRPTNGRQAAETAPAGPPKSTAEQVLEEVQRIAKERAKGLTLDSSIIELGLDSLERMEILASLEERFGGRFPEEVLPQLETCREVVDAVEKYLGGGRPAHHVEEGS
ncbi:MAG TPA: AMP-binding protein, partial [Pirellulales bacterium]|nr:AMP-binding protein [Pirellulales bacterium]